MKILVRASLAAAVLLASGAASADVLHPTAPSAPLPAGAGAGECYARVRVPAEYRDVQEQIIKHDAYEQIKIVPAVYETQTEQVMTRPASARMVEVAGVYEMVDRHVEVKPATQEWRRGKCNPRSVVDNATGECWCMVDVPATYKTVRERVLTTPASTRSIDVPAEYQTVTKRVLAQPEREERIPVPAVYETLNRKELVSAERVEWVRIECTGKSEPAPADTGWYSFPRREALTR